MIWIDRRHLLNNLQVAKMKSIYVPLVCLMLVSCGSALTSAERYANMSTAVLCEYVFNTQLQFDSNVPAYLSEVSRRGESCEDHQ